MTGGNQMEIKHDDWIQTYTGKQFFLINPTVDMIDIKDIAHALSMQCRFAGHIKEFYSVAEHSVLVSKLSNNGNKLAALLHDASEAYIADIASPFKPFLTNYKKLEHNIMDVVAEKFNFDYPFNDDIHQSDVAQLKIEARELLNIYPTWADEDRYATPDKPEAVSPQCLSPKQAEALFLETYRSYL
jgi:5'-deoxynucleotidase YfbR-like HD superfamily hydrolase